MADSLATPAELRRVIGVRTLTLSVINFIVGSAIFVVPATVAAGLGSAAILAYLVAGAMVSVVALCFAEAGSRVVTTGGAYAYVGRAFGPWAGFLTASLLWFPNGAIACAAVANALVGTLGTIIPTMGTGVPRAVFLLAVFGTFGWLNVRGVGIGARTVVILTITKLFPLVLLVLVGVWSVEPHQLALRAFPAGTALGQASLILVFALTGMETAMVPSGEMLNPSRTVPRAALLGVGSTVLLYTAIHLVAQGVLGPELAKYPDAPLAEVAVRVMGPLGRGLLLVGAIVSMTGYITGDLLSSPRALFVMAEDGLFPKVLGRVHERYRTPHLAIIGYCVITCGLSIAGTFTQLALLNAVGVLFLYLGVVLSVFKLRRDGVVSDRVPMVIPGGPVVPAIALMLILGLIFAASGPELLSAAGFLGLASVFYFVWTRQRRA